jgi:hypothetical protein
VAAVRSTGPAVELPARIRAADGRVYDGPLVLERHRSVQLGLLHADSSGYIEITPGTRPPDGKLQVDRRNDTRHYVPARQGWLAAALEHIERIDRGDYARREFDGRPREEVFVGVTPRTLPKGTKPYVEYSRFVWVDVDQPEELHKLWRFLQERPAHLVVRSGGSGGAHAYWRLAAPLRARTVDEDSGEVVEWVERANQRLIHHLGRWVTVVEAGEQKRMFVGADRACADRSRVMRVAGTVNHKTGEHARIAWADLALPGYDIRALVGDLPDMPESKASGQKVGRHVDHRDPYRRIPPAMYFARLAGVEVPRHGLVRCPSPHHRDSHPSCKVGDDATDGWYCHGCSEGGAIYDLASVLDGGPTGRSLRGEAFGAARERVRAAFGELT